MSKLTAWTLANALLAACAPLGAGSKAGEPEKPNPAGALLTAAREGNLKAIRQILSSGVKVDAKDEHGVTALFVAALFGQADAARLLIDKGADIKAAKGGDGSTALHVASFLCYADLVELLLDKGAEINATNDRSETPLDTVAAPWSERLAKVYTNIGQALGLKVDLTRLRATRPKIAALLRARGGKTGRGTRKAVGKTIEDVAALGVRASYYVNGRIYVNVLGTPEGKPVTVPPIEGQEDFKPSWSKTGDMLVFFRRVKNDPVVTNWKTAVCIIRTDGTGFHQLTDGTHTDFNPTWTRDGSNTPIWNRRNPQTGGFYVMASKVGNRPGQEVALSDPRYHTWAHTCLKDGRILVDSAHPTQGWGYFLMTPRVGGGGRYERIDCGGLARQGLLCRISLSPSQTKVCFEHLMGHKFRETGHAIYIADFDVKKRAITNARPIANKERKPAWFAYPRWTKDESAVIYHANTTGKGALFLYSLKDGSTKRVSTNPFADYRYPHGEATPK